MAILAPRSTKPNYTFPNLMLAPVAGVTDRPTREIARRKGCPLTFTELISAKGIQVGSEKTWQMVEECRDEHPICVQLFGGETDSLYTAVRKVDDFGADAINLNLGCPVKKVFKNSSGCGLTVFPTELVHAIRAMRKATDKHLSVKIRSGVNFNSLNYRLIGDIAQGEGCDALIFHARTRLMGFGGVARWEWIADLKEYLDIPVIGNGDVIDAFTAKEMLDKTGCDGVMVGRASYGNPWIFEQIAAYLETGDILDPPSLDERIKMLTEHIRLACEWNGMRGIYEMRKQTGWYLKGVWGVRALREKTNYTNTADETINAILEWRESIPWEKLPENIALDDSEASKTKRSVCLH